MIIRNGRQEVVDLGPRQGHWGNTVSLIEGINIGRPLPDGVTWRNTSPDWLGARRPAERRSRERAVRPTLTVICGGCDQPFTAPDARKKSCSARCRQRLHTRRLAELRRAS